MVAEVVGDPRFFTRAGPHPLAAIAALAQATAHGQDGRAQTSFSGVAPLQTATPADVSFLDNRRYAPLLAETRAGAVLVHPSLVDQRPPGCIFLLTATPYLAWARVCTLFYPHPAATPGRHASAAIDPGARIAETAEIGAFAVIGAGASIGAYCRIAPHAVIGDGVVVGADCTIGAHASISHAIIGDRVRIFPGVRIGQEGFGFAPDGAAYLTVPQLGRVVIEDDVEIGANCTIDRGSMHDTVIGAGSRLDNLVQIGHNVRCGRGCVIVAQAGISGSTILEDHVMVAGQAGLAGHLHIGSQSRIGAQAGVMADVAAGVSVMGSPCQPSRQYFRELAILRRVARRELKGAPALQDAPPPAAPAD